MSKTLTCQKCKRYIGEMEKGKMRNNAVILCKECWGVAEAAMIMAEIGKSGEQGQDFGNIFNELMKGAKK